MRLEGAACEIRFQVSAFSVSVLIGSKCLTAFRAIAHDTRHDQYRQFLARVLRSARDGQTFVMRTGTQGGALGRAGSPGVGSGRLLRRPSPRRRRGMGPGL